MYHGIKTKHAFDDVIGICKTQHWCIRSGTFSEGNLIFLKNFLLKYRQTYLNLFAYAVSL